MWQYTALTYSFSYLEPVCCYMSISNCCFLTCIQISQEAGQVVWYSHLFQNGKPLQCSCLENPMNSMKRQKDSTLKDELPGSVGAQYATGNQWRNNSRKNEEMEPKQKQHPVVDVTGDRSKVWLCKEQYRIGTWKVRSVTQADWKRSNRRCQEWMSTF